jgi:pyridoxine 5'-phosphate synthase PdxJ
MTDFSDGTRDFSATIRASVEADFKALQREVETIDSKDTKADLQAQLDHILYPAVVNVREAKTFPELLRAADFYSTAHRIFVLEKITDDHRERAQRRLHKLTKSIRDHDNVALQVAQEFRHLASDLERTLANSILTKKIEQFTTELTSSNTKLQTIVANMDTNNKSLAEAIGENKKSLSEIHKTLVQGWEGLIGPLQEPEAAETTQ